MNLKKRIIFALQLVVTILLLIYLFHRYNLSFSQQKIIIQNPLWLIFPFYFAIVFIPILAASRWKSFLYFVGVKANFYELLKINFISIFWGTFLPSADGFAAIRMYQIETKYSATPGQAGSSIIAEKIFGFLHLCLFGFILSFFINDFSKINIFRFLLLGFFLLLSVFFLLITRTDLVSSNQSIFRKNVFVRKIADFLRNMQNGLKSVPIFKALISTIPLIFLIQLASFLNVYLIFKALDLNVPLIYILAFMPIIQIISLIPITLSGFGLREGAFIYFFSQLGIQIEIVFAVSVINFAILTGIPAIIGGFLSVNRQIRKKENLT